jgi:hypothetical protein
LDTLLLLQLQVSSRRDGWDVVKTEWRFSTPKGFILCKVQQDALARSVTLECMAEPIAKATFNLAATQPLTADNYCRCGTLLAVLIKTTLSIY